jgi:hypothetical protein
MDRHRYLIPALALLTVWRLALLPTSELAPLESLAAFYADHPQLWHVEMGPLTPWLVALGKLLAGSHELGVRLLAPLLAFVASVCFWRLTRGAFDATAASWAVVFLQVMPSWNLCSIHMTSATVGSTMLLAYATALRVGLHRVPAWHGAWWAAAALMSAAVLADWRNALAWICTALFFATDQKRWHHFLRPGWWLISAGAVLPVGMCLWWNWDYGWPLWYAGEAEPVWSGLFNAVRWSLLVSPGLLGLTLWALSRKQLRPNADHRLLLCFGLPFLLLDWGWGTREPWPHMGWPFAWAMGIAYMAQRTLDHVSSTTQRKILMRTGVIMLAAFVSVCLMRTDVVRHLGLGWKFQSYIRASHLYRSFFLGDPSSAGFGWSKSSAVLDAALESLPEGQQAFVIAQSWELAASLNYYLPESSVLWRPTSEHPKVHALQGLAPEHGFASYARYDSMLDPEHSFMGKLAIYVSDTSRDSPPPELQQRFERWELISVVTIKHGGHPVRTLKLFACHGYRPLEL